MKILFCDRCRVLVPLGMVEQYCKCKRIGGNYHKNQASAVIRVRTLRGCRVLGIDSNLIKGKVKVSTSYVFDLKKSGLEVYLRGKLINKTPIGYVEKNAKVFLGNSIDLLKLSESKRNKNVGKLLKKLKIKIKIPK